MAYQKQQPNMLLIWHTRHENAKEVIWMHLITNMHPNCDEMNDMYGQKLNTL